MINTHKINEFIHAEEEKREGKKTSIYKIINTATDIEIAQIMWCTNFRKYALYPCENTVYDSKCLKDLYLFLDKIQKEYFQEKRTYVEKH